MNCKEAEKMIPLFLMKKLKSKDLNRFLIHVESCSECMEELTIQYLVMIGTSLIEEGKSFHLRKALNGLLLEARGKVKKWKLFTMLSYIFEVLTIAAVIIILIVVMLV